MNIKKRCGRLGDHLSHYWQGSRVWEEWADARGRWVKPVYWCSGNVVIEGGHHGRR